MSGMLDSTASPSDVMSLKDLTVQLTMEVTMAATGPQKIIMDLENLNRFNGVGCPACNRKFELGETAVLACGFWGNQMKYIHEKEAVRDPNSGGYVEKNCFNGR